MDRWEYHALQILKLLTKKEKQVYKELNKNYQQIIREIMADLSAIYAKLDTGKGISYADIQRFNDLQSFQQRILAHVTLLGSQNREVILKLLEEAYDLSYSYMSYAIEVETQILLAGAIPNMPGILLEVWDNPIFGLALEPALERDRTLIVSNLNGAIERGIIDGETYGGIARNIRSVFNSSLTRSMRIARTETHRVRERAAQDSSMNAHKQGIKMTKTWRNMADEKVRETKKANHVKIEGQTVPVDEPFVAISGAQGMAPGSMGRAEEDINCRCYSSRRVSHLEAQLPKQAVKATFKDWYKSKRG